MGRQRGSNCNCNCNCNSVTLIRRILHDTRDKLGVFVGASRPLSIFTALLSAPRIPAEGGESCDGMIKLLDLFYQVTPAHSLHSAPSLLSPVSDLHLSLAILTLVFWTSCPSLSLKYGREETIFFVTGYIPRQTYPHEIPCLDPSAFESRFSKSDQTLHLARRWTSRP